MNYSKENQGITLVALVITIIILLILAGVAMSMIFEKEGLFAKANYAGDVYKKEIQNEATRYNELDDYLIKYSENTENGDGDQGEEQEEASTYRIVYNSNGATIGTMPDQVVTYGVTAMLTPNAFTKTGDSFLEWNTEANGNGRSYTNGQPVTNLTSTDGGIINLYAQWGTPPLKYAVQIYGINQDEDSSGNTLGLTFGPANGTDYNNAYVTHTYEDNGDGGYNVLIEMHSVSAEGIENITTEYLKKSNGDNVTRTLAEKNKYDINLHNMTWSEIANTEDKTVFTDCMLCGDTKCVKLNLNSTISSGDVFNQYGDGAGVLKNSINPYYRKWNPSSSDNSAATNGGDRGSNAKQAGGYSTSHIRATLIGSNYKTNITHAGNVNLNSNTCLYSCIESRLKNLITEKKVKYLTEKSSDSYNVNTDIYDKIWLFGVRELYTSSYPEEGLGTNGDGYDVFGNVESKYYLSSYTSSATDKRIYYNETGSKTVWWLRTPHFTYTSVLLSINASGKRGYTSEAYYDTVGITFGFCI